ncbi:recombinase zinc beta ribbon domain-containing protein [Mesorhizobium abyssinicae]|uniref:recombinase zinc beta ribbon domain-containing protein n=1 Tax=Mesorhizobium abyssinicae TaxID=1209958 RepID=UPI00339652B9
MLVWNRLHFVKDPATGKRVSRANPPIKWIRTEVPHLRIVEDELWQAVKERQKSIASQFEAVAIATRKVRAMKLHTMKRPVSLLSGLLICGCCGGLYGLFTRERYACLNHQRRGICANGRTITREKIEQRVLSGLKERLVSADAVAEAVSAYAQETNRLNQERRAEGEQDRKALDKIERAIAGIMAAIEDGLYQPSMKARMEDLERQKAETTARLAVAPTDVPDLHPNIATLYRRRLEQLTQALADHEDGRKAAEALRWLIGEIVLTPGDKRGDVHAELRGELFGILEFAKPDQNQRSDDIMTKGVAGPRNQLYLRMARPSGGLFAF